MTTSKLSTKALTKSPTRAKRQYRTASQWQDILNDYDQSQLSQSDFCAQHGISANNLYLWRRKLANGASTAFDPLVEIQPPPVSQPTGQHWDVELELGEGRILRVRVR